MADEPQEPQEPQGGEPQGEPQEPEPQAPTDDVEAMRKALKKANDEAKNYRLKVKEYEDASKSEQEKLSERVSAAEERAVTAESDLLRLRVAVKKGIPAELADRLRGSTEEEMAKDADNLLATVGGKRTPDFDGGGRQPANTSNESFLTRAIRERR